MNVSNKLTPIKNLYGSTRSSIRTGVLQAKLDTVYQARQYGGTIKILSGNAQLKATSSLSNLYGSTRSSIKTGILQTKLGAVYQARQYGGTIKILSGKAQLGLTKKLTPLKNFIGSTQSNVKTGILQAKLGARYYNRQLNVLTKVTKSYLPSIKTNVKVTKGTPKINFNQDGKPWEFAPQTPGQTKIVGKAIEGTPSAEKFKLIFNIEKGTAYTDSKFITNQFTRNIESLNPKGVDNVLTFAQTNKGYLYGSFSSHSQMPKSLARIPADIDINVYASNEKAGVIAKGLVKDLKLSGNVARISKQSPLLIETKVKGEWHHAVDIHTPETGFAQGPGVPQDSTLGLYLNQKSLKQEGIKFMRLSEQGLRKGASITTLRADAGKLTIGPKAHRTKDIGDFFNVQETLLRSQGSSLKDLNALKKLYPGAETTQPVKVPLYSPPSPSASPSIGFTGSAATGSLFAPPSRPSKSPRSRSPSPKGFMSNIPLSPYASISTSPSPSRSISPSPSRSISPSPSRSISPSPSRSISISPYRSISQSLSPSPSRSISPSPSRSPSISPSPSSSPSSSPSGSPSISPSPSRPPPIFSGFRLPDMGADFPPRSKIVKLSRYKSQYSPSIEANLFNVKGKASKFSIKSGLTLRPIVG